MTNEKDIQKEMKWRVYLVYFAVCLFGLVIIGKALTIQIVEGAELKRKVESLTLVDKSIEAVRGNIYAEDGSLLATSIPIYEVRMDLNTEALTDEVFNKGIDSLSYQLSSLFKDKSPASWKQELVRARARGARYHLIKRNVRYTELKKLKTFALLRRGRYKGGFLYIQKNKREMPFQLLAARTIGYERDGVTPVGLEGAYSKQLSGVNGQRLMQKIAGGVWMPVGDENEVEPQDGYDIYSTIDINIQDVAESALLKQLERQQADHGCVVLMEVSTGSVKAIANLKRNANGNYYEGYNYAIGESTEPGSTFKLPALVAAIEDGHVDLEDLVDCGNGKLNLYDRTMYDSNFDDGGWGKISVKRIFEVSSNIGMAKIIRGAYAKNPQKFVDHLKAMSLAEPLGISIAGEGRPTIKNTDNNSWSGITLEWMAHGYEVLQTPLQILTYYNAIANNGKMVKPKFVDKITKGRSIVEEVKTEVINPAICSRKTIDKVKQALEGVIENGTATNLKNANFKIAGKTGTAQIANESYGYRYESKVSHQASFVGYFPAEDPKYSCIVVVNAPSRNVYYGNLVAGPIFKEVADKVYANSLEIHQPLAPQRFYASSKIPYSKSGYHDDVKKVFESLGVEVKSGTEMSEWISTSTQKEKVELTNRKLIDNLVPNVKGMGVMDAVYLLENAGLKVKFSGRGSVRSQSVMPGSRVFKGTEIVLELT